MKKNICNCRKFIFKSTGPSFFRLLRQKSGGFGASGPVNTAEAAVAFAITHKCIVIPDARVSVIRLF